MLSLVAGELLCQDLSNQANFGSKTPFQMMAWQTETHSQCLCDC